MLLPCVLAICKGILDVKGTSVGPSCLTGPLETSYCNIIVCLLGNIQVSLPKEEIHHPVTWMSPYGSLHMFMERNIRNMHMFDIMSCHVMSSLFHDYMTAMKWEDN